MFKLIKILNSGVNVPEPVSVKKSPDTLIKLGSALVVEDGSARYAAATEKPTHISLCEAGIGKDSLAAYEVFSNMLFEAPVFANPTGITVGSKLTLHVDDEAAIGLTSVTAGGVATVVDCSEALLEGDEITVKF